MLNGNYNEEQMKEIINISGKSFPDLLLTTEQMQNVLSSFHTDGEQKGEGALAVALDGKYTVNNQELPVCIKLVTVKDQNAAYAFTNSILELYILNSIHHPCVVKLLAYGYKFSVDERKYPLFFVLEKADQSLKDYLDNIQKEEAKKNIEYKFLIIIYGVAQGLAAIHNRRNKIIHRDIKPGNILLTKSSIKVNDIDFLIPLICDFNASKQFVAGSSDQTSGTNGTKTYLAPEILQRKPYNELVDIYSLGKVIEKDIFPKTNKCPETDDTEKIKTFIYNLMNRCLMQRPSERPSSSQICREIEDFIDSLKNPNDHSPSSFYSFYQQYKESINAAHSDGNKEDGFNSAQNWTRMSYGDDYDKLCRASTTDGLLMNAFFHEFGIGIDQDLFQALFLYASLIEEINEKNTEDFRSVIYQHVIRVAEKLKLQKPSPSCTSIEDCIHYYVKEGLILLRTRATVGDFVPLGRYIIYLTQKYFLTPDDKLKEKITELFEKYEKAKTLSNYHFHPGVLINVAKVFIKEKSFPKAYDILSKGPKSSDIQQMQNYVMYLHAKSKSVSEQ